MTIVFRDELLEDGRRLRASTAFEEAGRNRDNTWIFDRR
jgi:hypothetical protein